MRVLQGCTAQRQQHHARYGPLFKGSDHCLSFCFPAFPCGSTALTADTCCNQSCAIGWFTDAPGRDVCTACPAGMYMLDVGLGCETCNLGSVTNRLNARAATACTLCPAGRYSTDSTVACANCVAGSVTNTLTGAGATKCQKCPAGQFSTSSQSACRQCPAGSTTNTLAQDGASDCTECPVGRFGTASDVTCAACGALGANTQAGSTACICDAGFRGAAGSCEVCATNYFPSPSRCEEVGCEAPCTVFCEATQTCQAGERCNDAGQCESCPRGWEYNAVDLQHGGNDIRCDTMVEVVLENCGTCAVCPPDIPTMVRKRWASNTCDELDCDGHGAADNSGCYGCTNPEQWVIARADFVCEPSTCQYNSKHCFHRIVIGGGGYKCYHGSSVTDTCLPNIVNAISCMPAGSVDGRSCVDTARTSCRWINVSWESEC
eukprot:SAG22_NODE_2807_length_2191_cov_1.949331_2_plen_433_part_00